MSKIKFYRRVRNAIVGITGNSNERIITDASMVSPLVNDKGSPVASSGHVNKRSLKHTNTSQYVRSGTRNK